MVLRFSWCSLSNNSAHVLRSSILLPKASIAPSTIEHTFMEDAAALDVDAMSSL
jgi:hypothetical protein